MTGKHDVKRFSIFTPATLLRPDDYVVQKALNE